MDSMPEGYAPYVGNWRNIRPETYKEFEAFIHAGKDFGMDEFVFLFEIAQAGW